MGIQRAAVLYPVNTTTVDTGTGIDIRLLDSAQAAADDDTQTVTATHTDDNVNRTFDPATTGVTAEAPLEVLQRKGWALRLTEDSTPTDDTNCNAMLSAGLLTVNATVAVDQSGGTYTTGSYAPSWRVSLWSYDPSTDAGTLIAVGLNTTTTWNYTPATGDLGDFKTVAMTVNIGSASEIPQGRVLFLQIGLNTLTIPNPTLGTATWTFTLRVDHTDTNITFAAGQGIRAWCRLSDTVTGRGTVTAGSLQVGIPRTLTGRGTPTISRQTIAAKTFDLVGTGTVSPTKQVEAFRTATVTGEGTVDGTITIPIDEVPTGDAPPATEAADIILVDGRLAVAAGNNEYTRT